MLNPSDILNACHDIPWLSFFWITPLVKTPSFGQEFRLAKPWQSEDLTAVPSEYVNPEKGKNIIWLYGLGVSVPKEITTFGPRLNGEIDETV